MSCFSYWKPDTVPAIELYCWIVENYWQNAKGAHCIEWVVRLIWSLPIVGYWCYVLMRPLKDMTSAVILVKKILWLGWWVQRLSQNHYSIEKAAGSGRDDTASRPRSLIVWQAANWGRELLRNMLQSDEAAWVGDNKAGSKFKGWFKLQLCDHEDEAIWYCSFSSWLFVPTTTGSQLKLPLQLQIALLDI